MSQLPVSTPQSIHTSKSADRLERILPPVFGLGLALFLVAIMNRDYPFVGHDFRYFLARLIDTSLHIRHHGLSIQWYTPSFGGGLPAYPNPQHLEYSLVQWVSVVIDPWLAILLTTAAIAFLGYFYFYKFLHETLQLSWMASALGGLFFVGNGFYIEHMIAGHLGFQLFPLGAILLYLVATRSHRPWTAACLIALVLTLLVHQAGFTIAIILFLSLLLALPLIHLYQPGVLNMKQVINTSLFAILGAIIMSGSKLSAVSAFMQHFPRHIVDSYEVGIGQALIGIAAQLLGVMTLAPIVWLSGKDPELISGGLSALTGAKYGIWELDISLSPVLLVFLLYGLMEAIAGLRRNRKGLFYRNRMSTILTIAAVVWIILELTLARGAIYSLTKQLPVLESLHVNVRFTAAFILPLAILGAIQINRSVSGRQSRVFFWGMCLATYLSLSSYYLLNPDVHSRHLDVRLAGRIHDQIQAGNILPVRQIADVGELDGFLQNSSVQYPYEALFGYSLEAFTPEVHPGSVFEIEEGYFNMTHPASLVFPEINDLRPFERIPAADRADLDLFLQREQPQWSIPLYQKFLDLLSMLSVALCLGLLGRRAWLDAWSRHGAKPGTRHAPGKP